MSSVKVREGSLWYLDPPPSVAKRFEENASTLTATKKICIWLTPRSSTVLSTYRLNRESHQNMQEEAKYLSHVGKVMTRPYLNGLLGGVRIKG